MANAFDAVHSLGIQLMRLDAKDKPVEGPVSALQAGASYRVHVEVRNSGTAPCFMGLAEFYSAPPKSIDAAAKKGPKPASIGMAGFTVAPGAVANVACTRTFKAPSKIATPIAFVAQIHDPTIDPVLTPFDAKADRHVGRHDLGLVPDFSGTWKGEQAGLVAKEPAITIVLTQSGTNVTGKITYHNDPKTAFTAKGSVKGTGTTAAAELISNAKLPGFPGKVSSTWKLRKQTLTRIEGEHRIAGMKGAGFLPLARS